MLVTIIVIGSLIAQLVTIPIDCLSVFYYQSIAWKRGNMIKEYINLYFSFDVTILTSKIL